MLEAPQVSNFVIPASHECQNFWNLPTMALPLGQAGFSVLAAPRIGLCSGYRRLQTNQLTITPGSC